jgi:hypothetical protein
MTGVTGSRQHETARRPDTIEDTCGCVVASAEAGA